MLIEDTTTIWSLDDRTEFFTRQQMIDSFSLQRVTKSPASFDPKKLWAFQDHYMQHPLGGRKSRPHAAVHLARAKLIATADDPHARLS